MFINPQITKELYNEVSEKRYKRAKQYVEEKRIEIKELRYEDSNNIFINSLVDGKKDKYKVSIDIQNGEINNVTCQCEDYKTYYGACKHIIATMLEADENNKYLDENTTKVRHRYTEFKDLINTFYEEEMKLMEEEETKEIKNLDTNIIIEPQLIYDTHTKKIQVEFKIGTVKQMYRLKNLVEFFDNMKKNNVYKYGQKLEFIHKEENFQQESKPLLEFILKQSEIIKHVNNDLNSGYRYYGRMLNENIITLNSTSLDELFEILKNREIKIEKNYEAKTVILEDNDPQIDFELEKINEQEYKLVCKNEDYANYELIKGRENIYLYNINKIYRCSKQYSDTTLKLLEVFKRNYTTEIKFDKENLMSFFAVVMPKVNNYIKTDLLDKEEIENYMPKKLGVKVFLEFNEKNYIIAKILFCYKDKEFNPINEEPNLARNIMQEAESLNVLRKTGFMLDRKKAIFVLTDDEKIYNFLSNDINEYMQKFEVLATQDFKEKQIKQPKITDLGVKIENNLLSINIENLNFDKKELKEILNKYRLKKKYYRLKDGSFFVLEGNKEIEFIDNLISGTDIQYEELMQDTIQLPIHRSLYLDKILKKLENSHIKKDQEYSKLIEQIQDKSNIDSIQIPKKLQNTLRLYQKIGFKWLKMLDIYQFGGILADDMGLGKTLQIISIILEYKSQKEDNKKPIMVICPSSLSLNWKNEVEKFAPDIKTIVISRRNTNKKRKNK
ncbi:MAG: hypothetical protein HFJ53_07780 [Clostridia bacterium]|jgi:hypothetical protein|nr:hypothetical protein [Clostridia bacterium]